MNKTAVHVVENKVKVEIKVDKTIEFVLDPDEAMNLGIKLLRAAYAMRTRDK